MVLAVKCKVHPLRLDLDCLNAASEQRKHLPKDDAKPDVSRHRNDRILGDSISNITHLR